MVKDDKKTKPPINSCNNLPPTPWQRTQSSGPNPRLRLQAPGNINVQPDTRQLPNSDLKLPSFKRFFLQSLSLEIRTSKSKTFYIVLGCTRNFIFIQESVTFYLKDLEICFRLFQDHPEMVSIRPLKAPWGIHRPTLVVWANGPPESSLGQPKHKVYKHLSAYQHFPTSTNIYQHLSASRKISLNISCF